MAESPDSPTMDPVFDHTEGQSTANTNTTPNSDLSPPDSPKTKNTELNKADARVNSRKLASSLSLEEQVMLMVKRLFQFILIVVGITFSRGRFLEVKSYS
jgi:beta-glucosidase